MCVFVCVCVSVCVCVCGVCKFGHDKCYAFLRVFVIFSLLPCFAIPFPANVLPCPSTPLVPTPTYRIRTKHDYRRSVQYQSQKNRKNQIFPWGKSPLPVGISTVIAGTRLSCHTHNWSGPISEVTGAAKSKECYRSLVEEERSSCAEAPIHQ